jgi:hypothetical protein
MGIYEAGDFDYFLFYFIWAIFHFEAKLQGNPPKAKVLA